MSEAKHTPFPWRREYHPERPDLPIRVIGGDGVRVAQCSQISTGTTPEECEANARLVEDIPDLIGQRNSLAGALRLIADLGHRDKSCSLEAQGYTQHEIEVIGAVETAANIAKHALGEIGLRMTLPWESVLGVLSMTKEYIDSHTVEVGGFDGPAGEVWECPLCQSRLADNHDTGCPALEIESAIAKSGGAQ